MENSSTILHLHGAPPEAVESALTAIFANEGRRCLLRLEGSYRSVLARVTASDLPTAPEQVATDDPSGPPPPAADSASGPPPFVGEGAGGEVEAYRYLICRPHPASAWTPLLELGNRTDGLDVELSRALDGVAVFTTFVYDDGLSGYRLARDGRLVDQYQSDPTYFASDEPSAADIAAQRGNPTRFADLLPVGTTPEDFARVVLRPGWWEAYDADAATAAATPPPGPASGAGAQKGDEEEDELVDEVDRMRCIALALELWGPAEYPFAQELDTLENKLVGPVIALAYA